MSMASIIMRILISQKKSFSRKKYFIGPETHMTAIVAMALGQEQIKDPTPTEVSTTMAMPSMVSAYLFFEICCIYYSYYLESILFFFMSK